MKISDCFAQKIALHIARQGLPRLTIAPLLQCLTIFVPELMYDQSSSSLSQFETL